MLVRCFPALPSTPSGLSMDPLYLNAHLQTQLSPQMDDCCFPQEANDPRNGFSSYQPYIAQSDLIQASGEYMASSAWNADTTSLNSLCGSAVGYWPEQYQKRSFSEPAEAEVDQTENSSTASCCSMGEAGASPGSVGDCGYEYSSEQKDFETGDMGTGDMGTGDMGTGDMRTGDMGTGDMGFVVKEMAASASTSVAPSIMLSEAESQDDLESLNASEDSWLDSVDESSSSEQSVVKKYKGRTTFSAEQLRVLQQRFQLQRYVSASERQDLGNALGLSSQQVKTWFQNRRMKVKRILKEPFDGPQISFLQTDLSRNNIVVYGKPSDYMKQQFDSYSLPCLLPRPLVSTTSKQWPGPGPVYPSLGKFQPTLIKSELQYANDSVNFSIKKESIALSARELEPMKSPVTSFSHTVPLQHIEFSSLQRALSQAGYFQQGPSRPELLQQGPSRPGHLQQGPSRPGHLQQGPSRPGHLQQGPSPPGHLQQGPSPPGHLQQGPSPPGHLQQGPSRPGHLQQGPSRPGHLQQGLSFIYEMRKPAEDELQYEKVIIS